MNASTALDREAIRAIALAIGIIAIVGIGLSLTFPLLSLEIERRGISSTMNGLNTAFGGLANLIVAPFVPSIAGRLGVRAVIAGALALGALTIVAFPFAPFWVWFPLRFLLGASLTTLFILSEFWISAAAPEARRGVVMGVYATVLSLGFALGPVILLGTGTTGWPPYAAGAAILLASTLPLLLTGTAMPRVPPGARRSILPFLLAAPAATLAAFVFGAVETGGFALLPVYGLRTGLTVEHAAFLVSLVALGNVFFQIPIGLVADRIDRRVILLAAGLLGAVGASLIPVLAGTGWPLTLLLLTWGGVTGALYTVGLAHLGSRFQPGDLAQANAAFVMLYSLGLVIGPGLLGTAMDALNPHGLAFGMAALFAGYAAIVGLRMASTR